MLVIASDRKQTTKTANKQTKTKQETARSEVTLSNHYNGDMETMVSWGHIWKDRLKTGVRLSRRPGQASQARRPLFWRRR